MQLEPQPGKEGTEVKYDKTTGNMKDVRRATLTVSNKRRARRHQRKDQGDTEQGMN